ncbi:hypothetical protein [Streptomyces sp. CA-111067]|uniref:hypothetical protein n=1 Tax=Streptomyces sp. CA-111067 TaxID=3240046 RepID=UPI003D98B611
MSGQVPAPAEQQQSVVGVLAAVAQNWNGYNARPGDLYTAMAARLDDTGLLMTPEVAAELVRLRAERHSTNEALDTAVAEIRAKDTRITAQARAVHDALKKVAAAAVSRSRATLLEQQLAVRTFYLADYEGISDGPSLHTTVDAAKAWVAQACADFADPAWDWYEQDGVWQQWSTDPDTDRPVSRGAGSVTPLTVQGDGILAEAARIRQQFLKGARQAALLTEVRDSQRNEIGRLQTEQGELMQALGCGQHDEWCEVVHRARQLAGGGA